MTLSISLCLCVSGCEPELFENTLQLRERRLDLEELLTEEKKSAEALKKESDSLAKKVKLIGFHHCCALCTLLLLSLVCFALMLLCLCFCVDLICSAGEIGEEQPGCTRRRLGFNQQGETAENQ